MSTPSIQAIPVPSFTGSIPITLPTGRLEDVLAVTFSLPEIALETDYEGTPRLTTSDSTVPALIVVAGGEESRAVLHDLGIGDEVPDGSRHVTTLEDRMGSTHSYWIGR